MHFLRRAGTALFACAIGLSLAGSIADAQIDPPGARPSRPAESHCVWERFSNAQMRLAAWVQRCDYGSRKIDFVAVGDSLAIRYSDADAAPEPVVDVLDLRPGESSEPGFRRLFAARTEKRLAARCVLAPFRDNELKTPKHARRYTFVPNPAYQKQLDAKAVTGDVPDPACGDWGEAPDGIQYFEAQPDSGVAKVLFVRYGQDTPLFDEASLRLE
jgi:hypothetical protein